MNKLRFSGENEPWIIGNADKYFDRKSIRNHPHEEVLSVTQEKGVVLRKDLDLKIDYDKATTGNYKLVEPGDFIISLRSFQGGIEISNIRGVVSPAYTVLNGNKETDNEFYKHYFKSDFLIQKLSKSVEGIRDGKAVSYAMFGKINIPVPSLSEQEKIGGFLSALDEQLDTQAELVELLALEYTGYSQQIFSQKLRFKNENGDDYPEWEQKKLGELEDSKQLKLGRGRVISKTDVKENPGEYPIYSSSARNNGLFSKYGEYDFDDERITWSVDGGGRFFYRPAHKYSITNVCGWLKVSDENINVPYLYEALMRQWGGKKFDYSHKAHPSVIREEYIIPLPSLSEQIKIGGFLSSLSARLESERELLTQLREQKKAYLQKLLP